MRLILFFLFAGFLHGYAYSQSVAVSGNYKAVGSVEADVMGITGGAVYVFIKDADGNWKEQAKVVAPDAVNADRFGYSVDIDGDYLIVGATRHDQKANDNSGIIYFYHYNGASWVNEGNKPGNSGIASYYP